MANGAIYNEEKEVFHIHDRKLDALEDLIEGANGKPVLVAYWYNHDLERIKERFKVREIKTSKDIGDCVRILPYPERKQPSSSVLPAYPLLPD